MAARVQVVVEAKDATGGVFRALTSQLGEFGGIVEEITAKNVNWGNVAQQATQLVINGIKDSIAVTTQYAREVRDLSIASGQSAEESSRMLQVLDDYQLTAEDAKTATRALTKEGLAPTIDTIANLSSEFLKLTSVEERNAFVQKNLGRAGQEWLNLLNQGPEAIRAMNDAVSEGLILTDENIKAYEDYRLALDSWNDSIMAAKVSVGSSLLPVMTDLIDMTLAHTRALEIMEEQGLSTYHAVGTIGYQAALKAAMAEQEATRAVQDNTNALDENAASLQEQEAALKANSESNKLFIDTLKNVAQPLQDYRDGLAEIRTNFEDSNFVLDLYRQKQAELRQSYADGQISTTAYNQATRDLSLAYKDGTFAANEQKTAVAGLAAEYEAAKNKIALSIVEMRLATDGWTDAEVNAYLKVGQKLGQFDGQQVKAAQNAINMANSLLATEQPFLHAGKRAEEAAAMLYGFGESAEGMTEAALDAAGGAGALKSSLNRLPPSGTSWEYNFAINVHGRVPNMPNHGESNLNAGVGYQSGQQMGGEVFAGQPTWVGEAGREPFLPAQDGRILSHSEALHALALGGGGGGRIGPFYGPVTLQIAEDSAAGIMGVR